MREHGWQRPPGAERVIKPPAKAGPAQRLYENGASAEDLAALVGCGASYIHQYARANRWTRRLRGETEPPPMSDEIAAIEAALRDPALSRRELVRLINRGIALTAADVLATGAAGAERRSAALGSLAAIARSMPEEPAPACSCGGDGEPFPDANELIEEITRRFEEFAALEDAGAFSFRPPEPERASAGAARDGPEGRLPSAAPRSDIEDANPGGCMSEVIDRPDQNRFEMPVQGGLALAYYRRDGDRLTLTHTEVPEHLSGQGIGSRLAKGVFEAIRASGGKAVAQCPFMAAYADRHPEYAALLAR